jgi:lactate dehydrogenase-like 2-hydroxyacid dehydrogenase
MRKRVVVYRQIPPSALALLNEHCELTVFEYVDASNQAEFLGALAAADGILGNNMKVTPAVLDAAPGLQAASTVSAGLDAFDVDDLTRRGVLLTNTPDEVTETTADLVFSLILASARRVVELTEWARVGAWEGPVGSAQFGVDVHHKTLGIVGLGRIGAAVAQRAALGFGMNVLYSNRNPNREAEQKYGAQWRPLPDLLREADFVCLLVPLSAATEGLIGASELALMKRSAILINGARGQVVDEAALIAALRERRILGAGLDVFEREPLPVDSPLFQLPNVVATPHIGSATAQTREAMALRAATNLTDALQGRIGATCVNPEALQYRAAALKHSVR